MPRRATGILESTSQTAVMVWKRTSHRHPSSSCTAKERAAADTENARGGTYYQPNNCLLEKPTSL